MNEDRKNFILNRGHNGKITDLSIEQYASQLAVSTMSIMLGYSSLTQLNALKNVCDEFADYYVTGSAFAEQVLFKSTSVTSVPTMVNPTLYQHADWRYSLHYMSNPFMAFNQVCHSVTCSVLKIKIHNVCGLILECLLSQVGFAQSETSRPRQHGSKFHVRVPLLACQQCATAGFVGRSWSTAASAQRLVCDSCGRLLLFCQTVTVGFLLVRPHVQSRRSRWSGQFAMHPRHFATT